MPFTGGAVDLKELDREVNNGTAAVRPTLEAQPDLGHVEQQEVVGGANGRGRRFGSARALLEHDARRTASEAVVGHQVHVVLRAATQPAQRERAEVALDARLGPLALVGLKVQHEAAHWRTAVVAQLPLQLDGGRGRACRVQQRRRGWN